LQKGEKVFSLEKACLSEIWTRGGISVLGKNMHIIPRIDLRDEF